MRRKRRPIGLVMRIANNRRHANRHEAMALATIHKVHELQLQVAHLTQLVSVEIAAAECEFEDHTAH